MLVEPDAWNRKTHPPVYGIIIDMNNGCEPLSFIFDTDGKLRSITCILTIQMRTPDCHLLKSDMLLDRIGGVELT